MKDMSVEKGISYRRSKITECDLSLNNLSKLYPDEKKKKLELQNPEFRRLRSDILDERRLLSSRQSSDRRELRGRQRFAVV